MEMKTCPSCGTDVPVAASRCKSCFYDFDEAPTSGGGSGPMILMVLAALMVGIAAFTFNWMASQPTEERTLVDQETQTIQWIRQFKDGTIQTDQLPWGDILKLEYVTTSTGNFEIWAITSNDRKRFAYDANKPLHSLAEKYSQLMSKPLEIVENTSNFGAE